MSIFTTFLEYFSCCIYIIFADKYKRSKNVMVEKEVCHVVYNGMPLLKSIRDFNISLPPFPDKSLFLRKYEKSGNHDIHYYLNLLWNGDGFVAILCISTFYYRNKTQKCLKTQTIKY